MAGNLPDAKIVVRLDTQQAQKDLAALQKQAMRPGGGRPGAEAPRPVPTARSDSDNEQGPRSRGTPLSRSVKKVERTVAKLDLYAGAAIIGVAALAATAERVDPTGVVKKILNETLDGLLRGSEVLSEVNARISSLQTAIQGVKDAAAALQLGGDQADPETLKQIGVGLYEWNAVQEKRRAFQDRFTRRATGRAIGDLIAAGVGGGQ
jgi:hypothetical protein